MYINLIFLFSLNLYLVKEFKIILNWPPRFSSGGKKITSPNFQSSVIKVNFDSGIRKGQLESLFLEMVTYSIKMLHR